MVMDHYYEKFQEKKSIPWPPYVYPPQPMITQEEIEEFRKLLERAKEYDKKNNEPDCELEEKRKKVKDLAKELGVEIAFL